MSRYKLRLDPRGIIPRATDLTVKMRKAVTPEESVAPGCVPCCMGYELQTATGVTDSGNFGYFAFVFADAGPLSFTAAIVANVEACGRTDFAWQMDTTHFNGTATIDSHDLNAEGKPRVMISGSAVWDHQSVLALRVKLSDAELCLPLHIRMVDCTVSCPDGFYGVMGANTDDPTGMFLATPVVFPNDPTTFLGTVWNYVPTETAQTCDRSLLTQVVTILADPNGMLPSVLSYSDPPSNPFGPWFSMNLNGGPWSVGDLDGSSFQAQMMVGGDRLCDPIVFQCAV